MKKIIIIILTFIILFTGCSVQQNTADNDDAQVQSQPVSTSENAEVPKNNTDSSLLDDIDSSKSPFEKGYYDYQGSIGGNMPIQMSLYPLEKELVGSYFYESQGKEISLKGKAGAEEVVLYEYDAVGKPTGLFKGTMTTVDKIEGTWVSLDNKTSYPFTLSLKSILPGAEYGKRYAMIVGAESDQAVENYVSKVQSYILSDAKEQLAEEINYPINVKIDGNVKAIKDKAEFIANYDKIFYPEYKEAIARSFAKYMFVNWQGIMFGSGAQNIWFSQVTPEKGDGRLMIIGINN